MAADRKRMIQTLKEEVVPQLQTRGFHGSFPHFRRWSAGTVHLLSFQFNRHGGSFVVEVGRCPVDGLDFLGSHIPASEATVFHLRWNERIRLGSGDSNQDHWFRFDQVLTRNPYQDAARAVLPHLDRMAEAWWNRRS